MLATYIRHIWVCSILITLSSDIGKNMCSIPSSCVNFSICHWNLNTISAHNFIKISLLRVYVSTHNFNILCLPETYLDSIISSNDNNLTIPGYDLYKLKNKTLYGSFYGWGSTAFLPLISQKYQVLILLTTEG